MTPLEILARSMAQDAPLSHSSVFNRNRDTDVWPEEADKEWIAHGRVTLWGKIQDHEDPHKVRREWLNGVKLLGVGDTMQEARDDLERGILEVITEFAEEG